MPKKRKRCTISLPGPGKANIDFAEEVGEALARVTAQGIRRYCVKHGLFGEIRTVPSNNGIYLCFSPITPAVAVTEFEEHIIFTGNHGVVRSMTVQLAKVLLASRQFKKKLPRVERILLFPIPARFKTDSSGKARDMVMVEQGFSSAPDSTGREVHYYCHFDQKHFVVDDAERRFNDLHSLDIKTQRELLNGTAEPEEKERIQIIFRKKHEKREEYFRNNPDAFAILLDLFGDFEFRDRLSQMLAIARLITPYCRGLMGWGARSPCWFISADGPRSGKDYLAKMAPMLYEGIASEDAPLDASEDEVKRRITAAVIAGFAFVHFANCKGDLNSASLESAITSEFWTDRVVGTSEAIRMPIEAIFSLSYNSGDLDFVSQDLLLRSRNIHLAYALDTPDDVNKRDFRGRNLMRELVAEKTRIRIVAAINALVRRWIDEGCPDGPVFSSFPEWGRVVGGILMATFGEDITVNPATRSSISSAGKPAILKEMEDLIEEIAKRFPGRSMDFHDIVGVAKTDSKKFPILGTRPVSNIKQPLGRFLKRRSKVPFVAPGEVKVEVSNLDERRKKWIFTEIPNPANLQLEILDI